MKDFKGYLQEKRTYIKEESGGADYESAIVMGYYSAQGLPVPSADDLLISPKDYSLVLKDSNLKKAGEDIAKKILPKVGKKKKSKQLGRGSFPLTSEWKETGARDTTPKTDLIIGDRRISLKIGPSQLMSGGKAESLSTFKAALKENPNIGKTKLAKEILGSFDSFVTAGLTKGGNVNDYIKGDKAGKDRIIAAADKAHKQMISQLKELFDKSEEFKFSFAKEAMSGIHKFGASSDATAEFFLVGDKSGSKVSYHSINDESYVRKVADVMSPTVRFKSSSQKKVVDGIKTKTGKYGYWSVVSLVVSKMNAVVEEAEKDYSKKASSPMYMMENRSVLKENVFRIAYEKVKAFITNLIKDVKSWLSESIENIIDFLETDIEIDVKGQGSEVTLPL